jgi:hypothetical protein
MMLSVICTGRKRLRCSWHCVVYYTLFMFFLYVCFIVSYFGIFLHVSLCPQTLIMNVLVYGRAMAQAVSGRPLTTEAQVHVLVSLCGICGVKSGTGTVFSPSSSVFSCQCHSTVAVHCQIYSGGWTIGPLQAVVQRHSLTPSTWTATLWH